MLLERIRPDCSWSHNPPTTVPVAYELGQVQGSCKMVFLKQAGLGGLSLLLSPSL